LTEVIGVRFRNVGKVYYFSPESLKLSAGQSVIVETARGLELGECVMENTMVEDSQVVPPLRKTLRIASQEDFKTAEENQKKEKHAIDVCQQKITEHKLEMKVIDVEYTFDGSKILFYFTADGRVDFRELVKDLASVFRTRIELRQIGVRDEAKMLGGIGICGQPFCCATFLDDFQPVSIKMAKEQSLSLNPAKISGSCGRLMCCLKYEYDTYRDLRRCMPRVDSVVNTPQGKGTVTEINLLRGKVKVLLDNPSDPEPKIFDKCEVCPVNTGKKAGGRSEATSEISDDDESGHENE
jgi:cell fate regulator YaaT (PSP1 superfamily)